MANFKGSVYESTRAFTQRGYGEEGVTKILSQLTKTEREVLESATAVAWLPVEPVLRFHHVLDELYGKGDLELCQQAGRFSAGWSIAAVLKMFVRLRSPRWMIEKGTSVWGRYHDSGRWEFDSRGAGTMSGRLLNFEVRDPAFCARLRGWLQGAIELTGGANAKVVETRCACRGQGHCGYVVNWDE